ncbi:hypothetical protein EMIT0P253_350020 [Pseudomonas sp. IT-P253]
MLRYFDGWPQHNGNLSAILVQFFEDGELIVRLAGDSFDLAVITWLRRYTRGHQAADAHRPPRSDNSSLRFRGSRSRRCTRTVRQCMGGAADQIQF